MLNKSINVSSEKQSGGITSGIISNQNAVINANIWKGRKEGFFSAIILAIFVELIIRLIF